jgi:hypothetical protein
MTSTAASQKSSTTSELEGEAALETTRKIVSASFEAHRLAWAAAHSSTEV